MRYTNQRYKIATSSLIAALCLIPSTAARPVVQ